MKKSKGILQLITFSLLGFVHWFFGNLYEATVFAPNILFASSKVTVLENIRALFHISAPYYYFLPWSPLSILLVIVLNIKLVKTTALLLQKWASAALLVAIAAGGLTCVIIIQYNLPLWVGTQKVQEAELEKLFINSLILGNLRLLLVAVVCFCLYKCLLHVLTCKDIDC